MIYRSQGSNSGMQLINADNRKIALLARAELAYVSLNLLSSHLCRQSGERALKNNKIRTSGDC